MTREQILVMNERLKAFSSFALNLAGALSAAVAVRMWTRGAVDPNALVWGIGVVALMFIAYKLLYLMEVEAQ